MKNGINNEPSLGGELRKARVNAGLSQQQLSDKLKISRKKIGAIENEKEATMKSVELDIVKRWVNICSEHSSLSSKVSIKEALLDFIFR